jgi:hypothetical protein
MNMEKSPAMTSRNTARRHKGKSRQTHSRRVASHPAAVMRHWRQHTGQCCFVYFIREGDDGPVKIGHAINPVKRMESFQCGNSHELHIAAVIYGSHMEESDLHGYWGRARVRGEWFGKGYEAAVIEKAKEIADKQIAAHRAGQAVDGRLFVQTLFAGDAE